jgi:hypothetical protein
MKLSEGNCRGQFEIPSPNSVRLSNRKSKSGFLEYEPRKCINRLKPSGYFT